MLDFAVPDPQGVHNICSVHSNPSATDRPSPVHTHQRDALDWVDGSDPQDSQGLLLIPNFQLSFFSRRGCWGQAPSTPPVRRLAVPSSRSRSGFQVRAESSTVIQQLRLRSGCRWTRIRWQMLSSRLLPGDDEGTPWPKRRLLA